MNDQTRPCVVIEAGRNEQHYWRDLWRYRELLFFLCWRDILARYKQTAVGVAWSVIRPLLTMIIFTLVFGRLARLSDGTAHYPVLVLAGLLPWQFFANAVSETGNSLIGNANLLTKVYFPRLIIPCSSVIVSLTDFLLAAVILGVMMLWFQVIPDLRIVTLPFFTVEAIAAALGVGLWVAALSVRYRDFRYIVPFAIQLGLFISPVGFSSSIVPASWRLLYSFNPLVGIIDGFRWALLREATPLYLPGVLLSLLITFVLLRTGIWYFRQTEQQFADVV